MAGHAGNQIRILHHAEADLVQPRLADVVDPAAAELELAGVAAHRRRGRRRRGRWWRRLLYLGRRRWRRWWWRWRWRRLRRRLGLSAAARRPRQPGKRLERAERQRSGKVTGDVGVEVHVARRQVEVEAPGGFAEGDVDADLGAESGLVVEVGPQRASEQVVVDAVEHGEGGEDADVEVRALPRRQVEVGTDRQGRDAEILLGHVPIGGGVEDPEGVQVGEAQASLEARALVEQVLEAHRRPAAGGHPQLGPLFAAIGLLEDGQDLVLSVGAVDPESQLPAASVLAARGCGRRGDGGQRKRQEEGDGNNRSCFDHRHLLFFLLSRAR